MALIPCKHKPKKKLYNHDLKDLESRPGDRRCESRRVLLPAAHRSAHRSIPLERIQPGPPALDPPAHIGTYALPRNRPVGHIKSGPKPAIE